MTTGTEPRKHRAGDVLLLIGAGYLGLSIFGPLFFPYDVVAAGIALAVGIWIGGYKARWWPAARYTDREHQLNVAAQREDGKK